MNFCYIHKVKIRQMHSTSKLISNLFVSSFYLVSLEKYKFWKFPKEFRFRKFNTVFKCSRPVCGRLLYKL